MLSRSKNCSAVGTDTDSPHRPYAVVDLKSSSQNDTSIILGFFQVVLRVIWYVNGKCCQWPASKRFEKVFFSLLDTMARYFD